MNIAAGPFVAAANAGKDLKNTELWFGRAREKGAALVKQGSCLDPAREPVSELLTQAVSAANPAVDYKAWSVASGDLQALLESNIACDPASARNWSRLALLGLMQSYDHETTQTRMEASYLLSPVFYDDLAQRLAYWSRFGGKTDAEHDGMMHADIRTLIRFSALKDVVQWSKVGGASFRIAFNQELVHMPVSPRREQITSLTGAQ